MQVILTMLAGLVPGMLLGGWLRTRAMRRQQRGWPEQWDLQPRPLFTAHERALYRELRAPCLSTSSSPRSACFASARPPTRVTCVAGTSAFSR